MKKFVSALTILSITLGVVLTAGNALAKDWKKIRVGVEGAYPPFSFVKPDGNLGGFDIEIAKALGEAAGAEIVMVAQDWDGMIPALLARKYDCIIASMSITEERKKKVAFTNKYYQAPAKFVAKKGEFSDLSKAALKGKNIGVQRSSTHDKYLTDNYGKDVNIKRYGSQDEVYLDMTAGRLDLFISNAVATSDGFLKKPQGKDYEFVGPDLTDPRWYGEGVGIALRQQDAALAEKLNAAIEKIREDGTYKKIQDKYFDFNIYGN